MNTCTCAWETDLSDWQLDRQIPPLWDTANHLLCHDV